MYREGRKCRGEGKGKVERERSVQSLIVMCVLLAMVYLDLFEVALQVLYNTLP